MKRHLFFLLFAFLTFRSLAQAPPPPEGSATAKNSITIGWSGWIYADGQISQLLLGIYSPLSYDRKVWTNRTNAFSVRARGGVGILFQGVIGTEVVATGLLGKRNHQLLLDMGLFISVWELGYGLSPGIPYPLVNLGYRYQRPQGGFVWRAHVGTTGLGLGAGWAF